MKKISPEITRKVAALARLRLTEAEVQQFTPQLESIVEYIDQLAKVNVDGVEPLLRPFATPTPLREDRVEEFRRSQSGNSSAVLDHAPEVFDDAYRVPQVLGD